MPNTVVMFSISPQLALYGDFELEVPHIVDFNSDRVAETNSTIMNTAVAQIYASTGGFMYKERDGTLRTGFDLIPGRLTL
jgi:hypothetical protein